MDFEEEIARVLPLDVPNRERVITKSAEHLRIIEGVNSLMNLTRISSPREAAAKHVFDSVAPWRFFQGARRVLDAGTGAGFPGIPLALVFPGVRFTLSESIQKKARFVDSAVETLELANVQVAAERAESLAISQRPDVITARAIAPVHRIIDLFGKALRQGSHLLLYKGPDVEAELADVGALRIEAKVVYRYELPDGLGSRTLLSVRAQER